MAVLWKVRNSKLLSGKPDSLSQMLRLFSSIRGTNFNKFNRNREENDARESLSRDRSSNPYQNPPEPIPNRPLRGERPRQQQPPPPPRPSPSTTPGTPHTTTKANGYKNLSDGAFLDKFKLSFDKKKDFDDPRQSNDNSSSISTNKEEQENVGSGEASPPPEADEIFKKMKETGLIPNAVAMLDGLCKDGLVQEAMKLFGLMRERGTIPEVVIYTAVVDGFCKAQRFDDAKRIFRKMQDNGITPNAFSYTVLVQGLYKCNQLDDAVDCCVQMLGAGHSPNVTTFVGLIDGLCREKGVEEAQSVITKLLQSGFFINEKAIREFLDKRGPFSPLVREVVFGKKPSKPF